MWLLLAALVVSLGAVAASVVFVVVRATALVRGFRAAGEAVGAAAAGVSVAADRAAERAASTDGAARLSESLARLETSRARLRVLLAAWSDSRAAAGRIAALVPRK